MAEMVEMLGLQDDDLDDVVFVEEEAPPPESIRWMAFARVHTKKSYNQFWFFKMMRAV